MKNKKWLTIVIFAAASFSVALFTWWIIGKNTNRSLIHAHYFEDSGKPRLLSVFACTYYSEDYGTCLDGYAVELVEPGSNKVLAEAYIDRYHRGTLPPYPNVCFYSNENIWLLQSRQFIQGDTGYVKKIKLVNENFIIEDSPLIKGMAPEGFNGGDLAIFKNKYNESFCLDLKNNQLNTGACQFSNPQKYEGIKTAFLTVAKEQGSIRSRIYYYETDTPDPMQISDYNQRKTLLYHLRYSSNHISQPELDEYQKNFKSEEKLTLLSNDYFISPVCMLQTEDVAVFVERDRENKRMRYYSFNKNGTQLWKVDDPELYYDNAYILPACVFKNDLSIISTPAWVFAVNNATGKVVWKYIP